MTLTISSMYRLYGVKPVSSASMYQSLANRQSAMGQLQARPNPYEQYVKSAANGIAGFLQAGQNVMSAGKSLIGTETSSFHARTATSNDAKSVTATAAAGAANKSYNVKVNALASSQTNSGTLLSRNDSSAVNSGTNQFKITIGGKSKTITASISQNDTNEQALTKLRNAINDAKTGVTATIVTDKDTGKQKLELSSNKTGTDQKFEIEDEAGNAVAATGIGTTLIAASNASYSVNGGETQSSQSNTIELEKGKVTATLHAATKDEGATITVRPDADQALKQVKELVSSYNSMREKAKEAGAYLNSSILRNLDSAVRNAGLSDVGITRNADGTLKLDEAKFQKSMNTDQERTAKVISGKNGLADRLSEAAERYNEVPASALLNQKAHKMQQFLQYQSMMFQPATTYALPFASSGLLLNGFM